MDTGKKPWYRRIPGFRSGKWWKMLIASLFYFSLLSGLAKTVTTTPQQRAEEQRLAAEQRIERERLAAEKKAAREAEAAEKKAIMEAEAAAAAAEKAAEEQAEIERLIESADTSIEYKAVIKNLDKHKGKVVVWSGRVLNITEEKGSTSFQVSLEGVLDSFVAVYDGELPDVYKDDSVKVTGEVKGTVSGKNVFGATITAVKLRALKIVKIE